MIDKDLAAIVPIEDLAADVRPLLESPEDRALATRETITSLLDLGTRQRPTPPSQ